MREGPKENSSWPSSSCRVLASVTSKDRRGDRTMWLFPAQLLFLLLPGCSTAQNPITGPEEVRGQEQGSLAVQCRYTSSWRSHRKYWCRGPDLNTCEILVQTDASKQVKRNRVSIMDDQTGLIITVTMEDLRMSDADVYWCAIDRFGSDHKFKVVVNVDPASEVSPKIMTTIATVLTSTSPTTESTGNQGVTPTSPLTWSLQCSLYFKLLIFLELPVFLSMLSAVLWVNRPQRCCGRDEVGLVTAHSSDTQDREKHLSADGK